MSLQSEIQDGYTDPTDGLVLPARHTPTNNGVMYTGEYMWLLLQTGTFPWSDMSHAYALIESCFASQGLLQRHPNNAGGQEGPDDYLGALLGAKAFTLNGWHDTTFANDMFWYGVSHLGIFRNEVGGKLSKAFLWRQPQLVAATISAMSPGFYRDCLRWIAWPFYLAAATSIAVSCREDNGNTDDRRLSWILIQLVEEDSMLCQWAAKGWYKRLGKHYGIEGMRAVASNYYEPLHPFTRYHQWADRTY